MASSQFPPTIESAREQVQAAQAGKGRAGARRRPPVWALVVALAVIAGIVVAAVLLLGGDDSDKVVLGKPRIVSAAQLSSYASGNGRTVYWAGPAAQGFKLELTEVSGRRVFVRYLTSDAKAGDPRPAFTAIGTYPMPDAFAKLRASSSRPGAVTGQLAGGAMTLYYKKTPSNVYVARPGSNFLIEVFAPQPRAALQIAGSSSLVQVR